MKKNLLIAALAFCGLTANAQLIQNGNFESGDYKPWATWENKPNEMVGPDKAHSGKHAVEVRIGLWQNFNISYEENVEYTITAYTKYIWGEEPFMRLEYYDAKKNTLVEMKRAEIVKDNSKYLPTVIKFKPKKKGYVYRITAVPGIGKGGVFLMDDVTIEKKYTK